MDDLQKTTCQSPSTLFVIDVQQANGPPVFILKAVALFKTERDQSFPLREWKRTRIKGGIIYLNKISPEVVPKDEVTLDRESILARTRTFRHTSQGCVDLIKYELTLTDGHLITRDRG